MKFNVRLIYTIFKQGSFFTTGEVKSAQTFTSGFLKGLLYFRKVFPEREQNAFVSYDEDIEQDIRSIHIINFRSVADKFFQQ